jgi:excisionase family DNA binding protein
MAKVRVIEKQAQLIAREEAAARLRVHLRTVDRAAKRGELRSVHVGRRSMIAADSVEALIAGETAS